MMPTLFIMSGLPGVGKLSLAKMLAREYGAAWLRIDTAGRSLEESFDELKEKILRSR